MLSFLKVARDHAESSRGMNELVPAMLLITHDLVMNKNGSLTAMFNMLGVDLEGKTQASYDGTAQNQEHAFASFDERIVLDQYVDHRVSREYPDGDFTDAISNGINEAWKVQFTQGHQFRTRLTLAITFTPPKGAEGLFDRISGLITKEGLNWPSALAAALRAHFTPASEIAHTANEFTVFISEFEEQLSAFSSAFDCGRLIRLEREALLGALYRRINLEPEVENVSIPDAPIYLDSLLSATTVQVDPTTSNVLRFDGVSRRFVGALTVKDWPTESFPGMLDQMLAIPGEFIIHHSFRFVSQSAADDYTTRMEAHHRGLSVKFTDVIRQAVTGNPPERYDEGRLVLASQAADARASITAIKQRFGWYHFSVLAIGDTPEEVNETLGEIKKALNRHEVVSIRESMALLSTYAGTIPANHDLLVRWFFFSSATLADLAHVRLFTSGSLWNDHYSRQSRKPEPTLTAFPTQHNTPVFFSTHLDDLAHTLIVGPPGSGKTVIVNFMLSQFRKYPGGRVFVFDKDRSCQITTLLQGGKHINLMASENRGLMNPYSLLRDRDSLGNLIHLSWLIRFTVYLLESQSERKLSAESKELEQVERAIISVAQLEPRFWRLSAIFGLFNEGSPLKNRLSPWIQGNDRGHFFDNEVDTFDFGTFTTIEMGALLERDPVAAIAVLDYAVYQISLSLADDTTDPTIIYIEEVWFMLKNPAFEQIIENWLRVLRKKNAALWFATQALQELAGSNISAAILNSVPTRIFCPNDDARSEQNYKLYTQDFGLNNTQVDQIQKAQRKTNYLLVQGGFSRMVWARFDPTILACLRSDKLAHKVFAKWHAQSTTEPEWTLKYIEEMCDEAT